ncbi:MAG TPA: hypothetical protein VK656_03635, partial [Candidatus Acidoferrum sp.]|nr:hypothetical protein [Candidatus Acidoferrum sp.]
MTQRPTAPTERARACPFVAFEDDRDMRSDRPDHRHRCYAEKRPAPRAIAHQEAFCLSPAFPSCPTFQDWARREAAQARGAVASSAAGAATGGLPLGAGVTPSSGAPDTDDDVPRDVEEPSDALSEAPAPDDRDARPVDEDPDGDAGYEPPAPGWQPEDIPARNASRGWAAPPPWIAGPTDRDPSREVDAPGSSVSSRSSRPGSGAGAAAGDPDQRPAAGLASSRWLADVEPGDELDGDMES